VIVPIVDAYRGGAPVSSRRGDELRSLLESFEFRTMQQLGNIEKNDEAAVELADSRHVRRLAVREYGAWRLDF
jgi:hypothetical protein